MTAFVRGDFLPSFSADSSVNPQFNFGAVAGRQSLLVFVGSTQVEPGRLLAESVIAEADWLRERRILIYLVTADPRDRYTGPLASLPDRYVAFWDFDRAIHRKYRMERPPSASAPDSLVVKIGAFVVRENLRLHEWVPAAPSADFRDRIRIAALALPQPCPPWRPVLHAPVLMIPDVIDRQVCQQLIAHYETKGGSVSGFMRDVGGQTRGLFDASMKRRKDCYIDDQALVSLLLKALRDRVAPEIYKAFGYRATRIERYLIGCYDESDRGFFRPHRDNTSKATAHRAFAVSLNLNSEDYDGGYLAFPEYGSALYKPETGGAVVFSCSLLHEAMPVTRGRRYVVLPFLFDERGATVRGENRRFLADSSAASSADGESTAA